MSEPHQRVVVIGASKNPERYSNMAINRLLENGHEVIPVHPALERVSGVTVIPTLGDVKGPVDTVTVYVSPESVVEDDRLPRRTLARQGDF